MQRPSRATSLWPPMVTIIPVFASGRSRLARLIWWDGFSLVAQHRSVKFPRKTSGGSSRKNLVRLWYKKVLLGLCSFQLLFNYCIILNAIGVHLSSCIANGIAGSLLWRSWRGLFPTIRAPCGKLPRHGHLRACIINSLDSIGADWIFCVFRRQIWHSGPDETLFVYCEYTLKGHTNDLYR